MENKSFDFHYNNYTKGDITLEIGFITLKENQRLIVFNKNSDTIFISPKELEEMASLKTTKNDYIDFR